METEFAITSDLRTDPGRKRDRNEDFLAFFEPDDLAERQRSGALYIVADGVGGAKDGEIASRYAAGKILYDYYHDDDPDLGERLRHIIQQTGNDIFEHSQGGGRFKRMATTVVAALVQGEQLIVANVGDSRAYLIRNGEARLITHDHTIAGELLRDHRISEEEARDQPGKNRLTRSVGGEIDVHVDLFSESLMPGDRILLCSDGLARYTVSQDIAYLASSGSPEEITQRCIDYANGKGGVDNVTVAIIEIGPPSHDAVAMRDRAVRAPVPVDLDTLATDPSIGAASTRRRGLRLGRSILLATASGIAVLVILAVVFAAGKGQNLLAGPATGAAPSSVPSPSPTCSATPALTTATSPTPITPTVDKPMPTTAPSVGSGCVYQIRQNDLLGDIALKFLGIEGSCYDLSPHFRIVTMENKRVVTRELDNECHIIENDTLQILGIGRGRCEEEKEAGTIWQERLVPLPTPTPQKPTLR